MTAFWKDGVRFRIQRIESVDGGINIFGVYNRESAGELCVIDEAVAVFVHNIELYHLASIDLEAAEAEIVRLHEHLEEVIRIGGRRGDPQNAWEDKVRRLRLERNRLRWDISFLKQHRQQAWRDRDAAQKCATEAEQARDEAWRDVAKADERAQAFQQEVEAAKRERDAAYERLDDVYAVEARAKHAEQERDEARAILQAIGQHLDGCTACRQKDGCRMLTAVIQRAAVGAPLDAPLAEPTSVNIEYRLTRAEAQVVELKSCLKAFGAFIPTEKLEIGPRPKWIVELIARREALLDESIKETPKCEIP